MALPSSIRFIEAALSCTSPFALSYTDPKQIWFIREHLLSLLQDFPVFAPSTDTYFHDDGTEVNLLVAHGKLPVSHATSPVPLTIWLHQEYPYAAPMVFLCSSPTNPIPHGHPFIEPSGAIKCPYLQTWLYPRCNLTGLAQNLVRLFTHHHPFCSPTASIFSDFTHSSMASKTESLDRLAGRLHYDMMALQAKTMEDIEELSSLQAELVERADITKSMLSELEHEKENLKHRVKELTEKADILMNWLKVHDPKSAIATVGDKMEEVFQAVDSKSEQLLNCWAADCTIDDLLYALDKAMEGGVVTFEKYIKQVRTLAREQFFHRAMQVKLRSSDTLHGQYQI